MTEKLTIVNVKDVDEDAWRHFVAEAVIRKINTGELLSKVLREWLSKESFNQRARVQ